VVTTLIVYSHDYVSHKKILMKKLGWITVIYWGFVGLFIFFNAHGNEMYYSFPRKIMKMSKDYPPLQSWNIEASAFFKDIPRLEYADSCEQFIIEYQWSLFYPSKGLSNIEFNPENLILPSFQPDEYLDFDSCSIKEKVKPIIDSMYLNEFHKHEFRFESHYPVTNNSTVKPYYQRIKLIKFYPENSSYLGLVSDAIDVLDGARIELNYELRDSLQEYILLDENTPLIYEIKSTADTVSHIFSFHLKDHQFFDIQIGFIDLNIIPPPQYGYSHITKDMVGDLIYIDSIPVLVTAFENGMLHLVYDERAIKFYLQDFYFYKDDKFLDSKIEGTIIDFSFYNLYRKNAHVNAKALCNELYSGDNFHEFKKDIISTDRALYYKALIISMGCDPDEIYIAKQHRHFYDDILGSRVMSFRLDTVNNEFGCMLLKKDEYGTLRALHEDTTRTGPQYEGLVDELEEYLTYPMSTDRSNEIVVKVQAMVHKDGTMTDIKLFFGSGDPLLDEDALNAVKSLKNKWIPSTLNGEPIDLRVLIPIYYEKR